MFDKEKQESNKAQNDIPFALKGIGETFEDKSAIKLTRGPFHAIESLQGLKEDHFLSCEFEDIIQAANTEPLKLLVLGKPRSGKSTLCERLA